RQVDADDGRRPRVAKLPRVITVAAGNVDQPKPRDGTDRLEKGEPFAVKFPRQRFDQGIVRPDVVIIGRHGASLGWVGRQGWDRWRFDRSEPGPAPRRFVSKRFERKRPLRVGVL